MEENKVILKLDEYIKLIRENEILKEKLEHKENNYIAFLQYAKQIAKDGADYHLKNIEKNFNLEDILVKKLNNYHYKNIADEFIKMGITYDLIEQLTDELLKEREGKSDE